MKKLTAKNKLALWIIALVLTNVVTGVVVYKIEVQAYNDLKIRTADQIDKNIRMNDELDAYHLACPDFLYED